MASEQTSYKIRKSFLLPTGLVALLTAVLLVSSVLLALPTGKIIILVILLIPTIILFVESFVRRVTLTETTITIKKLFRTKTLNFADLTAIDTIRVRKRVFISLSSENDFAILSNSYEGFSKLISTLLNRCSQTIYTEDTRKLAQNPPRKCGDIFSAWLAVAVLLLILYVQFKGMH
jgi:uncharacterized membrane protein